MKRFIISSKATIKEALQKIDENKKGFLIVLNKSNYVIGTLTDGDIRRQLIQGTAINDLIQFNTHFEKLESDSSFDTACELFKSEKINFLPILFDQGKLADVITKKQFHALLLQDHDWRFTNDFYKIDEYIIDHEIFNRPWGFYKSTVLSNFVQSKIITIFPNEQLSLQEHKKREEHWVVIKGEGQVVLGESILEVYPGKYIFIPKGCRHQLINTSKDKNLIITEVQLGEYFGEDDIIRFSDKYGRI